MANSDVTTSINSGNQPSRQGRGMPYLAEADFDIATAVANRVGGSALAANDVVLAMDIPAKTMILSAGLEVLTATDGGTATCDLGTGVDADAFADGFDWSSTTVAGTMSQVPAGASAAVVCQAADTLDVTVATQSGAALTVGKIRVFAVLIDISATTSAGIA